jgi:hypothetical protein
MGWIRTLFREGYGLFVDDGSLAFAVIAWIGFVKILLFRIPFLNHWQGIIMFAGLASILVESTIRFSRKNTPTHIRD